MIIKQCHKIEEDADEISDLNAEETKQTLNVKNSKKAMTTAEENLRNAEWEHVQ
jgi:hypothetical protein